MSNETVKGKDLKTMLAYLFAPQIGTIRMAANTPQVIEAIAQGR